MRDMVWVTRDGQRLLVSQMETSHIVNCVRKIQRSRGWRQEYLDRLILELRIRELGLRGVE
jgi:hypothetical protein